MAYGARGLAPKGLAKPRVDWGASPPGDDIYAHEDAGKGVDGTITYPGKRVLQRQREFRVLRPFVNRRGISHAKHEARDSPVLFTVRESRL